MQLKVLVLNLWNGGELLEDAIDFIIKADADILFLQEVCNSEDKSIASKYRTLDILKDKLKFTDHDYAPEFVDNRREGRIPEGNAIFSKFPITYRDVIFFDRPFDENYVEMPENYPTISHNLEHVTVKLSDASIDCFNFHGVWDLDGDNYSEARKKMSEVIIKAVRGKNCVILAGDTNAKPTNQAITKIEGTLKSVFGNTLVTTFNMKRKDNPGYATAAVDMLFVSKDIEIVSSNCPTVDISDHLPLLATLRL